MRILTIIFVLSFGNLYSQTLRDSVFVDMGIYKVIYSEVKQQPLMVEYEVLCYESKYSRKGLDFRSYKGVVTSNNQDYKNNVWDKGHIAPAADFNCDEEDLKTTFSYLNCSLQHEGLNRGPWKDLEKYERVLLKKYGKVTVKVTVNFEGGVMLPYGAELPTSFTKIITTSNDTLEYRFPNENLKGLDYSIFRVAK